ncbi:UbiA family prenyltransferase [Roseiconus lacunae]|uniref:UbiA family prenyltransferase n=1 Tax=Roseiconus lacunae TaxID=2605694 RepID=UPI001E413781|nr:UbiA family prenyltransferase [Roseiconus lacunae]MCD0460574.1 UbiA family prenyltransferase [Roseiconus lacunae]
MSESATTRPTGSLLPWLQLIRLPTVFTVLADVSAAYLLIAGGPVAPLRLLTVLVAGVALYWAGMVLNDVFDVDKDRHERPGRPIPSGAVSLFAAKRAGWILLIIGVLAAAASGYVTAGPADAAGGLPSTWFPAVVAMALASMVVAYDGPLKATPFAPAAMGSCRFLSFMLGASAALPMVDGLPEIPRFVWSIALGFGVYVMGITTLARDEATGGDPTNRRTGFVLMLIGIVMLAFAPGLATAEQQLHLAVRPTGQFVFLIVMIGVPVIVRAARLQLNPTPKAIGLTIRAALLTIIPFAAAFAFLGAGPNAGLAVFALVAPAILLSKKLQVT